MKIAILRRNGIGDLVCTYPLIQYLKKRYPQAQIHLFINKCNKQTAKYLFNDIELHFLSDTNKYLSIISAALKYRKLQFDIAISAKPTEMKLNNIFLFLLGAKQRFAVINSNKWHTKLINHKAKQIKKGLAHQAIKSIKVFDENIDSLTDDLLPRIYLADNQVNKNRISQSKNRTKILFSVSNNRATSLISNNHLLEIASIIKEKFPDVLFIISALKKDQLLGQELVEQLGHSQAELHFSQSFDDFLALINRVSLVIVGDGGICHLAALLDKKLIALYGVTHPNNWGPLHRDNRYRVFYDIHNVNNLNSTEIAQAAITLLTTQDKKL